RSSPPTKRAAAEPVPAGWSARGSVEGSSTWEQSSSGQERMSGATTPPLASTIVSAAKGWWADKYCFLSHTGGTRLGRTAEEWKPLADVCLRHPLRELIHQARSAHRALFPQAARLFGGCAAARHHLGHRTVRRGNSPPDGLEGEHPGILVW